MSRSPRPLPALASKWRTRLRLLSLEDRTVPATMLWRGDISSSWGTNTGGNTNWFNSTTSTDNVLPANGDDLFFPAVASNKINTNNLTGLSLNSLTIGGDDYVIGGNAITVASVSNTGSGTDTLNLGLNLTSSLTVSVPNAAAALTLGGVISGSVGLTKTGAGTLTLSGTTSNTYSGTTTVQNGVLQLNKSPGALVFSGDLVIGDDVGTASSAVVRHLQGGVIGTASTVTVNSDGLYDLGDESESFGPLVVDGGSVDVGAGLVSFSSLTMTGGAITASSSGEVQFRGNGTINSSTSGSSIIGGHVQLNGSRTLTVADGAAAIDLTIASEIREPATPAGLTKAGSGTLRLSGSVSNTYTGVTTVSAGTLELGKAGGVGGAVLALIGDVVINGGTVREVASSEISNTSDVTVNSGGTFDLNGVSDIIGALTVAGGSVTIGTGTLTSAGDVTMTGGSIASTGAGKLLVQGNVTTNAATSAATISGNLDLGGATRTFTIANGTANPDLDISAAISNGNLTKAGAGTLALGSDSTASGATTVSAGTLQVNGVTTRTTTVNSGGALRTDAAAQVGAVTINSGSIDPAGNAAIGVLTIVGNAILGPSAYVLNLGGPSATAVDQLVVQGTVTLNNATTNQFVAANFSLAPGTEARLIDNDGTDAVVGTFSSLPQGQTISFNGVIYTISYTGGTGNDVVLIAPPAPPAPRVTGTQINDGSTQRSRVTSLTVTFSTVVTLPTTVASAFGLARQSDGALVNLTANASNATGVTVVTLNGFTGGAAVGGSLADGTYSLTVLANLVTVSGQQLDGNGDGTAGDNFVFADSAATGTSFYRLFGDANGDRAVNGSDLTPFVQQFGSPSVVFDFNGDGFLNGADLNPFIANFGKTI